MTNKTPNVSEQFDTDLETGVESYKMMDHLNDRLAGLGVISRPRPKVEQEHESIFPDLRAGDYFDGRMPAVIRKLSIDQLSDLQGLFNNWFAYLSFQTKLIAAEKSEALKRKELGWSRIRDTKKVDDNGNKRSDQQRSDATRFDIRFIQLNVEYQRVSALYDIMMAVLAVSAQDLKTISREVTLKQMSLVQGGAMSGQFRQMGYAQQQFHADNFKAIDNLTVPNAPDDSPDDTEGPPRRRRLL